jgi:preprotein translocase subunit SecA
MNSQREVIYDKRKHALFGERLSVDISNMIYDVVEQIVQDGQEQRDFENFQMELLKSLAVESPFNETEFFALNADEATTKIFDQIYASYIEKSNSIKVRTFPVIKDVFENNSQYENIAIPINDGRKQMNLVVNLKRAYEDGGREVVTAMEKSITLGMIDDSWKEHLREMDDLKQSVQNATYEQKDPLLIYKFESFELFKLLVQKVNKDISSFLVKGDIPIQEADKVNEAHIKRTDNSNLKEEKSDLLSQAHSDTQNSQVSQPIRVEKKVGRNEECPCGSGKKYKHCHGKNA